MRLARLPLAIAIAAGGVIASVLVLAGAFSQGHIQSNDSESPSHGEVSGASASSLPLDVKQTFKGREKGWDAAAGENYFVMDEDFVDDESHCDFCMAVEYRPGPYGKAMMAFTTAENQAPLEINGAKWIAFSARGETGGEKINVYAAGSLGNADNLTSGEPAETNRDFAGVKFSAVAENLILDRNWQRYQLKVENAGLTGITHAFAFEVLKGNGDQRQVIYLDSVFLTDKRSDNAISLG